MPSGSSSDSSSGGASFIGPAATAMSSVSVWFDLPLGRAKPALPRGCQRTGTGSGANPGVDTETGQMDLPVPISSRALSGTCAVARPRRSLPAVPAICHDLGFLSDRAVTFHVAAGLLSLFRLQVGDMAGSQSWLASQPRPLLGLLVRLVRYGYFLLPGRPAQGQTATDPPVGLGLGKNGPRVGVGPARFLQPIRSWGLDGHAWWGSCWFCIAVCFPCWLCFGSAGAFGASRSLPAPM